MRFSSEVLRVMTKVITPKGSKNPKAGMETHEHSVARRQHDSNPHRVDWKNNQKSVQGNSPVLIGRSTWWGKPAPKTSSIKNPPLPVPFP